MPIAAPRNTRSPSKNTTRALAVALAVVAATLAPTAGCAHDLVDGDRLRPVAVSRIEDDTARRRRLPFLSAVEGEVFDAEATDAFVASLAPTPEQDLLFTRVNQKLGLQPDTLTYGDIQHAYLRSGVAAIYLPESRTMAVFENPLLDQAALLNLPLDVLTGRSSVYGLVVSHEYVHALQDQHFDLDRLVPGALYRDDEDRALAKKSLIETEANLVSYAHVYGFDVERFLQRKSLVALLGLNGVLGDLTQGALVSDVPEFIRDLSMRQYDAALGFIDRAMQDGGWRGVDAVYVDGGPESTEQLLWPEKYFDERDDPTPLSFDVGLPGFAPEQRLHASSFGELQWRVLFAIPFGDIRGIDVGRGWDGDRYEVWDDGERTLLTFRTVWDSDDDAREFMAALEELVVTVRYAERTRVVRRDDDRVVLAVAPKVGVGGSAVRTVVEEEVVIARDGNAVVWVDGARPLLGAGLADALIGALSVDVEPPTPPPVIAAPVSLPPATNAAPLADQVTLAPRTLELSVGTGFTLKDGVIGFSLLPLVGLRWSFREGLELAPPFIFTLRLPSPDVATLAVSAGVTAVGPAGDALPWVLVNVPRRFGLALTEQTRAFDVVAFTGQVLTETTVLGVDDDAPLALRVKAGGALSTLLFRRLVLQVGAAYEQEAAIFGTKAAPRILVGSATDRAFRPVPMVELRVFGGLHLYATSLVTLEVPTLRLSTQRHEFGVLARF